MHHRPLHPIPCPVAPHDRDPRQPGPEAGNYIEARMDDYDPAPTSDEEIEQAYQEKYG